MSVYLDASVLIPIVVREPNSDVVDAFLAGTTEAIYVSEFAIAEVASGLSRLVRTRILDSDDASTRLSHFDTWRTAETVSIDIESADVRSAGMIVRRFELKLRTPDALHVAVCRRLGASLVTLDNGLAIAARALNLPVLTPSTV